MRTSLFTALLVSILSVSAHPQPSIYELSGLVEEVLFRRGSPGSSGSPHAASPPKSPFISSQRSGSPSSRSGFGEWPRSGSPPGGPLTPLQAASRSNARPLGGSPLSHGGSPGRSPGATDPTRSGSPRAQPTLMSPQLPPGNLFAGGPARPRRQRRPPRAPSDGESDSSADDLIPKKQSKVKIKATGPADLSWDNFGPGRGSKTLQQGERFKQSFRGDNAMDAEVNTKPGGKARVTVKGYKKIDTFVHAGEGASGSITPMQPDSEYSKMREVLTFSEGDTVPVAGGESEHRAHQTRPRERYPIKFSTKMNGPGRISVDAEN